MSELVIELGEGEGVEKVEEALRSKPLVRRLVIRVAANDRVSPIELLKGLLVGNISRTIMVYAKGERDEA